jgi:hypothetical protein
MTNEKGDKMSTDSTYAETVRDADASATKEEQAQAALKSYQGTNPFVLDVASKASRGLTYRQADAVLKAIARDERRADDAVNAGPAPENGKSTVEGEIVFVKWYESEYGTTQKMMVRLDNGSKVFVTVPKGIWTVPGDIVGARVEVTATWTRKDEHFAFGKRPVGKVIEPSDGQKAEARQREEFEREVEANRIVRDADEEAALLASMTDEEAAAYDEFTRKMAAVYGPTMDIMQTITDYNNAIDPRAWLAEYREGVAV